MFPYFSPVIGALVLLGGGARGGPLVAGGRFVLVVVGHALTTAGLVQQLHVRLESGRDLRTARLEALVVKQMRQY